MSRHDAKLNEILTAVREAQSEVPMDSICLGAELIERTIRDGKHLWIAGNGGSSATATHLAADLVNRAVGLPSLRVRVNCLSDNNCLLTALVNDHGWESVYRSQLAQYAVAGDAFIAISVLGGSKHRSDPRQSLNLLSGLETAKERGCNTLGIIGASGGLFAQHCDVWIGTKHSAACVVEPLHSLIAHLLVELVVDLLNGSPANERRLAAESPSADWAHS